MENTRILLRMRDVGLALGAAAMHDVRLNRIQLQKNIYLIDAVAILYQLVPPRRAHETYKHGPFDPAIQNAADCLAFRGFVVASNVSQAADGTTSASYTMTPGGRRWLKDLLRIKSIAIRWTAAQDIASQMQKRGWHRLRDLVYAEPTFVEHQIRGYGQRLTPDDLLTTSTAQLVDMIKHVLQRPAAKHELSREFLLELTFRYLDAYARSHAARNARSLVSTRTQ